MFKGDKPKGQSTGKSRQYAQGFRWGKIEHDSEKRTTRLLVLGLVVLGIHMLSGWKPLEYSALIIFVLALVFRIVAAVAHGREKHYMDSLRFGKKN